MSCGTIVNFCAARGLVWAFSVENLKDAAGAALDLTPGSGNALVMRVGVRGAADDLLELTTASGWIAAPVAGAVVGEVPAAQMLAFPASDRSEEYVHSLVVTNGGTSAQVWQGILTLHNDPTTNWSA